jgi:hypothetical protein
MTVVQSERGACDEACSAFIERDDFLRIIIPLYLFV